MSLRPRSRLCCALVASAALAVSLLPATAASAGSPSKSTFRASILPASVPLSATPQPFTLTVTNTSSGTTGIGSVQVAVPAGFTVGKSQQTIYMQPPVGPATQTDWVYSWPSCSSDSPCTTGSTLVQVNTPNNGGADKVPPGYSLLIPISATVGVAGCQIPWPVAAKNSAAWSSGQLLTPQGPVPAVSVGSTNPQLVVGVAQDEAGLGVLVTNQPFDVPVFVRDSTTRQPVCFSGTVTLIAAPDPNVSSQTLPLGQVTFTGTTSELTNGETISGALYPSYGNVALTAKATGVADGSANVNVSLYGIPYTGKVQPGKQIVLSNSACVPSADTPVCGTLLLPNGAYSTQQVVLSQGTCTGVTSVPCLAPDDAVLVNATADIGHASDGTNLYDNNHPATMVLQCDKSLCGGGGVNTYPITFQSSDLTKSPISPIPPCPAKGTVGAGQVACQDYVQNHRDNAGDLIAYVLFLEDTRMNF